MQNWFKGLVIIGLVAFIWLNVLHLPLPSVGGIALSTGELTQPTVAISFPVATRKITITVPTTINPIYALCSQTSDQTNCIPDPVLTPLPTLVPTNVIINIPQLPTDSPFQPTPVPFVPLDNRPACTQPLTTMNCNSTLPMINLPPTVAPAQIPQLPADSPFQVQLAPTPVDYSLPVCTMLTRPTVKCRNP